jgi:nitroreductase
MSKLLDVIRDRRSDRHFANKPLEAETIEALLDAFRWAPSSNNRQPWRVLIASGAEANRLFDDALSAGNKQWAPVAPLKMVIIGVPEEQPEKNGLQNFMLDLGFAMENMMLQGYAMGLTIHAMAGWDYDKICKAFAIPANAKPVALMAAGYRGRVEDLIEEVRAKDLKPRTRKAIAEFTYRDSYGAAFK